MTTTEPALTQGWEADLDPWDTITRRFLLQMAEANHAFATAADGRCLRTPAFSAADHGVASGYFNAVTLLRPLRRDDAETLDGIAAFAADGSGSIDIWSMWPTPDLTDRGWHIQGHPPLLVRPPASLVGIPDVEGCDVREVTDLTGLADWERVAIEGYPFLELADAPAGALGHSRILHDPRLELRVGYEDGRPVSIGTLFAEDDLATFVLGVTRPEARGRGHWLAHAAARIASSPTTWMAGVFSEDSRPLAERIGFIPVARFTLWTKHR